ncbi:Glucooligosaccharide oxidase [Trichoderma citrinoviride]|uniref:Glucooligosaccharide oxidase n=1 Tax=Trichoderma citrinoviride TaxID=58853 RepID=A0A2T4B6T5_9HYPO|nr:Glucooligosaccharide oxidase [Trichoderma citrinoviride]PTB65047.1 Glucooligosaccharide oxidase [Trichoderma citrinoviride]
MADIRELIQTLKEKKVPVFAPGEPQYERSVATVNLFYRFARPDCVVQPRNASDVQFVVREARIRRIPITIKNGGHSYSGASTAEKGISLDLMQMNGVTLNMKTKLATVKGGAQWGHVYKQFVNKKIDGYIVNGGRCPTVGVSGFILGGGLSPFTRSFGMGCDSLEEVTIVTASGDKVKVKKSDDPQSGKGRLFWALCGAGGGNFGVVVEMKLRIERLRGDRIVAGRYTWHPDFSTSNPRKADEYAATMSQFYTADFPKELTIDSTWLCDLQESKDAIRFLVYHNGGKAEFDKVIDDTISSVPLATQLKRRSLEEASSRFLHETLVVQWSEEIGKSLPLNLSYNSYASFVFDGNDRQAFENISVNIQYNMVRFREKFTGERGLLQVTWIHAGGQAASRKPSDTAFFWRDGVYHTYITLQCFEKFLVQEMEEFLDNFKKQLRSWSLEGKAAFINFPDRALACHQHEEAYFGDNRTELQAVKKLWDGSKYFRWEQGSKAEQFNSNDYMSFRRVTLGPLLE